MLHGDGEGTLLHLTSANVVNQNRLPVVVGNLFFWQLAERGHDATFVLVEPRIIAGIRDGGTRGRGAKCFCARFIRVSWTPDMDIAAVV